MRMLGWKRALVALAMLAGVAAVPATTASATGTFRLERLAGGDRYATAAVIALDTFDAAPSVLLASGENFPDALAGNYLAGRRGVPILLTRPDIISPAALNAIGSLGATKVTLLGGEGAISAAVAASLTHAGLTVDRIAGPDRFATSASIAVAGGSSPTGTALLASGLNFPDALAAGPIAYSSGMPQLLTAPGGLSPDTTNAITTLHITKVVVLGGEGAVSATVVGQLRDLGVTVTRLAGDDRYDTAARIARYGTTEAGLSNAHVDVATGLNFPDALAGGPHAGEHDGIVLLTEADPTDGAAQDYLLSVNGQAADGHILGGSGVVSDAAQTVLQNAGRGQATGGGDAGPLTAIAVSGNHLVDADGVPVRLQGVDRESTEYACIFDFGISSGPIDPASLDAMATWKVNAVRVPLNSDCWLGTKDGLDPAFTGEAYRTAIAAWVDAITDHGMVAIVDLHWSAPNGVAAEGQQPMADMDTSVPFWTQVATAFKDDPLVAFDLFNEPYLDRDPSIADPWACWRDGCTVHVANPDQSLTAATYEAAGMQDLVDAVRATGATNPLLIGGLGYTQLFDQYLTHLATDPLHQIAWSFHAYPGNPCGLDDNACRAGQAAMAVQLPMVVGEVGRDDCTADGIEGYLDFVDSLGASALAWTWIVNPDKQCGVDAYDLITDYDGTPTVVGQAFKTHFTA